MTGTEKQAGQMNSCCSCGADVTHARRLKSRDGRYWCATCGAADQAKKKTTANLSPCPRCGKLVGLKDFQRDGELYVCPECWEAGSAGRVVPVAGGGDGRRLMVLLAIAGVLAVLMGWMWWDYFGG